MYDTAINILLVTEAKFQAEVTFFRVSDDQMVETFILVTSNADLTTGRVLLREQHISIEE